jgi:general secretion pathway protein C
MWDPMDLAKSLAQWRSQSPEQWLAQANRALPPIAAVVLVVLIAFQAAGLTWRLLDAPTVSGEIAAALPPRDAEARAATPGAFDALANWQPFGRPPEPTAEPLPSEVVLDAEETSLNLTLHSTLQAQDLPARGSVIVPEGGIAIIASGRAEQKRYRPGDTLDDGSGTRLHSVYVDRVLLDRGGRLERLSFPKPDSSPQASARPRSNVALSQQRPLQPAVRPGNAASMADAVTSAIGQIGQFMQIAPQEEGGQMVGYRLQPRGDGAIFQQLGLEPGDVLTEVNGIRLSGDIRNTAQVFQILAETTQASVIVRRNGVEQPMVIDVGQIQRLSESLQ